jgi:DNA polymerase zeta
MRQFSATVVHVDFYMAQSPPPQPAHPIIRIFGVALTGQKCCIHVHGARPYFFVRCENDPVFDDPRALHALLPRIATGIEAALEVSEQGGGGGCGGGCGGGGCDSTSGAGGAASGWRPRKLQPRAAAVSKLSVVRATPFYGYHSSERLFVKVKVPACSTLTTP